MGRFLFFILLVANLAFGAHLWLSHERDAPDLSRREKNAGEVKIVSVTPPVSGQRKDDEARRQAVALAGAACVEFSGIAGTEIGKGAPTEAHALPFQRLPSTLQFRLISVFSIRAASSALEVPSRACFCASPMATAASSTRFRRRHASACTHHALARRSSVQLR